MIALLPLATVRAGLSDDADPVGIHESNAAFNLSDDADPVGVAPIELWDNKTGISEDADPVGTR